MRAVCIGLALALACSLMGTIRVQSAAGTSTTSAHAPEVQLAPLAVGSSVAPNGVGGSAVAVGTLLTTTTNLLWLNNTNASGAYAAKLVLTASSGASNLGLLALGIDNGTQTVQVTAALGALTQTSGPYVVLAPGTSNRIYVTEALGALGSTVTLTLALDVADSVAGRAYAVSTVTVAIQ